MWQARPVMKIGLNPPHTGPNLWFVLIAEKIELFFVSSKQMRVICNFYHKLEISVILYYFIFVCGASNLFLWSKLLPPFLSLFSLIKMPQDNILPQNVIFLLPGDWRILRFSFSTSSSTVLSCMKQNIFLSSINITFFIKHQFKTSVTSTHFIL